MPDSCLLRRFCLLSIAQFCVLKILQNSNFDCQMKEHERISYGSSTFLEINILTSIFLGAAYTELQFLLPPAPSDHPAHPPEVQIPDNWNEHPVAHPTWLPAFPKALRCTTGSCVSKVSIMVLLLQIGIALAKTVSTTCKYHAPIEGVCAFIGLFHF